MDIVSTVMVINYTATTEIYTHSLHDALPIYISALEASQPRIEAQPVALAPLVRAVLETFDPREMGESVDLGGRRIIRSEEHTSELQSPDHHVCRLLLYNNISHHLNTL